MTDTTAQEPQAAQKPAPQLNIRNQMVRSLTVSNPAAFTSPEGTPAVTVNIHVDAQKASAENEFVVGIRIDCGAKTDAGAIYDVKLDYAGQFHLANVEQRALEPVLLIECPRILFPFARRIIADATRDAGYAPLMLDPVDFVALFRREVERRAAAAQAESNGSAAS